jgi:hypothetical protein
MKTLRIISQTLAAGVLTSLFAAQAIATCDTGARAFPGAASVDSRNLACNGASAIVAAQNSGGTKSVAALLSVGNKRARTNGIDAGGAGMLGCFIEDATAGGGGQSDNTGCASAVKWIGTLFAP